MKILIKYLVIINLLITINSFGQVINVDDFGAKGNGVTDDRVAIQSALNQLRSNGGELQFTSGKVYIIGSGLVFNNAPSSRNYLITSTETEKATIKIKDGTPVTYGNWGLFMSDSRNVTISNLRMDGNRDNRVPAEVAGTYLFQIMNNCNGLRLYDVILENSVIDNLMITATNDVINDTTRYLSDFEMYNCVLKNGWRNNMSIIRGMNFKIIGCEFDNAHGLGDPEAGIDFEPNGETSVLGYHNILIEGCIFRNNGRTGITLIDHDEIDIEGGVTIRNNLFDNNGIMMMGQDNVIKNNVFINYDHAPVISYNGLEGDGIIYIYSDEATANNKVYENYFYDNPMPADKNLHLIHFGSRIQESNSAYNNYEYNNRIAGFVKVSTSVHQDVHDNVEINRKEIGYWSMDASTINGNSLADSSYFVQNGTLHNSPAIVNGQYNEALDFSPDNKYVEIPIADNLNIEVNMTISAWVNWKGANSETEQVIVGKDGDWEFSVDNTGKLGFYSPQSNMASYNGGWIKTTESIIQDEWTYVAFTYNGMESKIYMNGVETASKLCNGNLSTNSTKIYIGSLVGETFSFNGIVDDVKMYNYPLSSSEIDSLSKLVSGHNKTKPLGVGTASSPYQISSIVNLSWLAQSSDKWSAHYIQVADIDLSITATWDDSDDNNDGDKYNDANDKTSAGSNDGWYPIGNSTKSFTGTYNGQGFLLSNLTIKNREKSIGLFGKVTGGELKNIALNKLYMEGNAEVGGLAGVIEDHCTISNSYTNGEIKCIDGGNVGKGFGGLIGRLSSSTINRCYSQVDIEGAGNNNQTIGGLVGMVNSLSNIIESYSLGNIELAGNSSGGFVGMLDNSTVSNSYSFGALSISNSSLMGYGGFIGSVQGGSNISYCYSIGLVDTHLSGKGFVGEIASGSPNFTSNVFDKNLSGQESSVGGVGKTSEEMMTESTFSNMGWNFVSIWKTNGSYPNLRENSNKDLEYGGTPGEVPGIKGDGTEEDPYQIARLSDLSWLSQNNSVWELNFIQMVDIDASQTATWDDSDDNNDGNKYNDPNDLTTEGTNDGFLPIGNKTLGFTGNYNGNNYSISNLTITRPNGKYVGLFGQIKVKNDMMSTIENLLLTKMKIIGDGYVGGLVGKNFLGQIKNCSTEGEIGSNTNGGYIGGLVGCNIGRGTIISKSYADVNLNSSGSGQYVGGFVGRNRSEAEITKCYSKGSVESGGNKVGGFIGQNAASKVINSFSMASVSSTGSGTNIGGFCGSVYGASIEYCYSIGVNNADNTKGFLGAKGGIGNVFTSNYLDTLSSGCNQTAVPEAASGKTTSEMQTASTFVGWDFANVWSIEGSYYPLLTGVKVGVKENKSGAMPTEYVLEQNYPNPFNPTTVIRFSIPKQAHVKLSVFNVIGEKVAELVNGNISSGNHEVNFNASTSSATASNLSSGIYLYRITATSTSAATGSFVAVKKMLLIK